MRVKQKQHKIAEKKIAYPPNPARGGIRKDGQRRKKHSLEWSMIERQKAGGVRAHGVGAFDPRLGGKVVEIAAVP